MKQSGPSYPNTWRGIINLADSFIRQRGFNAFSYKDISIRLDVQPPAIHYYFPTKADLGITVIENDMRSMRNKLKFWQNQQLTPEQQLKEIINIFFQRSRKGEICLTGALASSFNTFSAEMQEQIKKMCDTLLEWMTGLLEKGRTQGQFRFEGTAADRALHVISTLMSGLLLSRVMKMEEIFDRMTTQLLSDLGSGIRISDFEFHIKQ